MPAKNTEINFERSIKELESIVENMESGDLSLESAMTQFEKGVVLTRQCQQALQAAEQKVKILLEKNKDLVLEDFDDDVCCDDDEE
jgi:exodeoxyribonuclease VII small subunit